MARAIRVSKAGHTYSYVVADSHAQPTAGPWGEVKRLQQAPEGEPEVPLEGVVAVRDCVGFLDHIMRGRRTRGVTGPLPEVWNRTPAFYFANAGSLTGATADVRIPADTQAFDFEFEVAAVVGEPGRDLTAVEAGDHIAGYLLFCDWSARDLQANEREMQIGLGKGKDTAISLGPWVLTADEASQHRAQDGFDLEAVASINGGEFLRRPFRGMDWSFEELVAYSSVSCDLHTGDLVASGTVPGGCLLESSSDQDFRGWLTPGDRVRLELGPLGAIDARVAEPSPRRPWQAADRNDSNWKGT